MPHIHMLLILDKNAQITTPEQVDQFVSARIPALPPMNDTTVQANQQRRLWHYVTSMMLHDCNKACLNRRTIRGKETDVCSKNFPKPYSDETIISGWLSYELMIKMCLFFKRVFLLDVRYTNYVRLNGFFQTDQNNAGNEEINAENITSTSTEPLHPSNDPEHDGEIRYCRRRPRRQLPQPKVVANQSEVGQTYVRKKTKKGRVFFIPMDDSRAIPYNPYLLLKFGCHINIEYVFGQKACKYIFKYLLKGHLFYLHKHCMNK